MEYRMMGKTSLRVSAIGIGSYQLSGPILIDGKPDGFPDIGYDSVINLIHACEDLGINLIDSAEIYGAGEGERRIGKALYGRRDQWIISTKFGWRRGKDGQRITNSHSSTIRSSLEGSLSRLNTDYIDIYLYHTPAFKDDIDAGIHILQTLKKEGKIRFFGISTDEPKVLQDLTSRHSIDVVQFAHSLLNNPRRILKIAERYELGTMIRGSLQSGILSGKYLHKRPELSEEDIRKSWFESMNFNQFTVYEKFIPQGYSMVHLALRYLLDLDTTDTIILGGKSISDYQDAIRAVQMPKLSPGTHRKLKHIRSTFYLKRAIEKINSKINKFTSK